MGWLALKFPQAYLYMSVQGSAERSMEERSRPGSGFSAAGGAGAGVCWAGAKGARTKQARAAVAARQRARRKAARCEARRLDVSLMRGFSVQKRFVEQMVRFNRAQRKQPGSKAAQSSIIALSAL